METKNKKKILLVDDDQDFIYALSVFLTKHEYEILVAYDATYAIQHVANNDLDLIVLDMGLPGGGGLFVLKNLRRIPKNLCIPIIVSTASVVPEIEKEAFSLGASDFINKPYELDVLLEKVKKLFS